WVGRSIGWDLGAGPAIVLAGDSNRGRLALTGHTGLMLGDVVGVTAQVLVGRTPGFTLGGSSTKAGLYLGGKLGSYPGVVGGIAIPALVLLYVVLHRGAGD